jgi:lipoprotein-releasing system ATP-binding protein
MSEAQKRVPLLAARGIRKSFAIGERSLEILHGVHMELYAGEVLALMGPSGAGKSTLLHVLGLLDEPSEGEVLLGGKSAWTLPGVERARLRNRHLGFVFQFYHLLSELTALENVLLQPMIAQSRGEYLRDRAKHVAKARDLLARFGLTARMEHRPSQLSGGERQRVALARALFGDPPIVIADEPTGNLDSGTGEKVLELIFGEQASRGYALLLVTHDERLAARCHRQLYMDDGQIQLDSGVPIPQ